MRAPLDEGTVIAFVFPGQGAQYVGMGADLAQAFPESAAVFQRAGAALDLDLQRLCWQGPEETLSQTEYTQPAILTSSCAALAALSARDCRPGVVAGLSLGEYSALVCAGVLTFEDALRVVRSRGRLMQSAVQDRPTAMAAIIGLDAPAVQRVCAVAARHGVVEPTNYNSPGQVVIAGDEVAVREAIALAKSAGARRAVLLPVSAPFHTSLMRPAAERLASVLEPIPLTDTAIPVVSNVTAQPVTTGAEIRRLLVAQVATAVRWEESVRTMAAAGATTFVEVGPGTSLTGMIRKTVTDVRTLHVEDRTSLEDTVRQLREEDPRVHGEA